jgi:uncharacterized protein YcfJ
MKKILLAAAIAFGLALPATDADAQTVKRKGWSKKAKGGVMGAVGGAAVGAAVGGGKGAAIGAAAGGTGGYLYGKRRAKKKGDNRPLIVK